MEAQATPRRPWRRSGLLWARDNLDRAALLLATVLWTVAVVGAYFGRFPLARAPLVAAAYPALLCALLALRVAFIQRELRLAAAWSALIAGALIVGTRVQTSPELVLAVVAVLAVAVAASRYPVAALASALLATTTYASLQAFYEINPAPIADLILAGLWVGLLVRTIVGWRPTGFVVLPAVLVCGLYIGITAFEILTASSIQLGYLSFRFSTWPMLGFILVAYAGWSEATYRRLARTAVVVAVAVAGYAVYRWLVGPAPEEYVQGAAATNGINFIEGRLRTFGSFPTGHTLGFWAAVIAPFCLALALASRDRWRITAGAATILCVFALLAAEGRAVLIGAVLGMGSVLALFQLAGSLRGPRLGAALLATVAVIGAGSAAFAATAGSTDTVERYERIFSPGDDEAYQARQHKWRQAMVEIREHPFGQGLGSAGQLQETGAQYYSIALFNLDSSYLKIAYEQGFAVMVLFIVAMVTLLATLVRGGVTSRDPEVAWRAAGACGALVAFLVSAYAAQYIETPSVLTVWILVGIGLAGLVRNSPGTGREQ